MGLRKNTKQDNSKEKSIIYIGPNIKNIVNKNQIFINLPQSLIELKKICPEIEHLLVKVGKPYADALKELATKGSITRCYYEKVFDYVQNSMKGA